MSATSGALRVDGVTVHRGGRPVVREASFAVSFGEIVALIGPNGAGKSTLLRAALGLLPLAAGVVSLGGEDARALSGVARARRVAYVPQASELRAAMAVEAVVAQGRYAHGELRDPARPGAPEPVAHAMELTETRALGHRSFPTLSQGERQRVLLARALATGARVLLLDEPTAALDVGHALRLHALLRRLAEGGYAVLAVLHDLDAAARWTDRAVLLDAGRVREVGPSGDVVHSPAVESLYGVRLVPAGALGFRLPHEAGRP